LQNPAAAGFFIAFQSKLRNIHAVFGAFLAGKAHGYCVYVLETFPDCHSRAGISWGFGLDTSRLRTGMGMQAHARPARGNPSVCDATHYLSLGSRLRGNDKTIQSQP
jgi:hypothetical protein